MLLLQHLSRLLVGVRCLSVGRMEVWRDHSAAVRAQHSLIQTVVDILRLVEGHHGLSWAHILLHLLVLSVRNHGALTRHQRREVLRLDARADLARDRDGMRGRVDAALMVLMMISRVLSGGLNELNGRTTSHVLLEARVVGHLAHDLDWRLHGHLVVVKLACVLLLLRHLGRSHSMRVIGLLLEAVDLLIDATTTVRHDLVLLRGQCGLTRCADGSG